jgi:hypothetical protein
MASSLVSGAVVLLLILIGGYVIAGGILTIAETVALTQSEMTLTQENILQTAISISTATWSDPTLTIDLLNTGSTSIKESDPGMDLFLCDSSKVITLHPVSDWLSTLIVNDTTNKNMWDPSETLRVQINPGYSPIWAKFVTPYGVSASTNIP